MYSILRKVFNLVNLMWNRGQGRGVSSPLPYVVLPPCTVCVVCNIVTRQIVMINVKRNRFELNTDRESYIYLHPFKYLLHEYFPKYAGNLKIRLDRIFEF